VTIARVVALTVAAVAPLACRTVAAQEQPAVIPAPTAESRAELARVVTAAVGGRPVTLADDALTRDSVLALEQRDPPSPAGRVATGRTLEPPQVFRLVLRGSECVLVRDADQREWRLTSARCAPAAR
jgi:hypothetical protein